jgi:hypothetical protein
MLHAVPISSSTLLFWLCLAVIKFLIMHSFLRPPVMFSLFGPIFSASCYHGILSLRSSPNVRDQVNPRKTTKLCFVCFKFYVLRHQMRRQKILN